MSQLPNTAQLPDIIASLQNSTGVNVRPDLADKIGSPAVGTDDMVVLLSKFDDVKTSLIAVANDADANNSTVKADVISKINNALGLTLANTATWTEIRAAIIKDADKVSGNIRAGVNIDGVAGKTEVIDTTTAVGAAVGDIASGKEAFVNGAKRVGTYVPTVPAVKVDTGSNYQYTASTTFKVAKRLTMQLSGTFLFGFILYSSITAPSGYYVRGQLFKNGVAFGAIQNNNTSTATKYTQTLDVVAGDVIELRILVDTGAGTSAYVTNMTIDNAISSPTGATIDLNTSGQLV